MHNLRPYQEKFINELGTKIVQGKRRVVAQLATGAGKTVTFSTIVNRYLNKSGKNVLIMVHREELLKQTIITLHKWYGIVAETVNKNCSKSQVYVAMVETLNNKLKKQSDFFSDVGLLIADEVHIGNFHKIYDYFPSASILGFTATPISASKKRPLNGYFEDIVCGIDIPDLIASNNLVKNVTIHPKGSISRKTLSIKSGEFDDKVMGAAYSKAKQVQNTLSAYSEFALGTKTLVFNCNIEHSRTVNEAFLSNSFNSRHLDSTCTQEHRRDTLQWFKETPDAILNNVGILTTGFDEPSIQTIIVNKDTLSIPLWLQMCGRGSRPYDNKPFFRIIDMGTNVSSLGDWDFARDWKYIFNNPGKVGEGVAPVKDCPKCFGVNHAAARECKCINADGLICGYLFPIKEHVEMPLEFAYYTKNIDIQKVIADNEHRKEYYTFFKIPQMLTYTLRRHIKEMHEDIYADLTDQMHRLCKEWCKEKGKQYNKWHKEKAIDTLNLNLNSLFKWQPQQSE